MRPNIKMTTEQFERRQITILALKLTAYAMIAYVAAFVQGCYVGKAAFQGEKMQIYPLFSTSAASSDCSEEIE